MTKRSKRVVKTYMKREDIVSDKIPREDEIRDSERRSEDNRQHNPYKSKRLMSPNNRIYYKRFIER